MGDVCIVLGPLSYHLSWVHLSSAQLFEHAKVNGKETCWMTNRWSPMLQRTGIPSSTRRSCKSAIFWSILCLSALSTWKTTTPSKFHNVGSSLHKRPSFFVWNEKNKHRVYPSYLWHFTTLHPVLNVIPSSPLLVFVIFVGIQTNKVRRSICLPCWL